MIPISAYAQVKNKYCIAYLGPDCNIITKLIDARNQIENKLSELEIHLSFRDDLIYLAKNQPRIISISELKDCKKSFGYIRQITNNMIDDPVDSLLEEM